MEFNSCIYVFSSVLSLSPHLLTRPSSKSTASEKCSQAFTVSCLILFSGTIPLLLPPCASPWASAWRVGAYPGAGSFVRPPGRQPCLLGLLSFIFHTSEEAGRSRLSFHSLCAGTVPHLLPPSASAWAPQC